MKFTKELASEILTGLDNKTLSQYADEPAKGDEDFQEMVDTVADLVDEHGMGFVSALAQHIEDSSEDVRSHELQDYTMEHFRVSGHSVGEALQEYAASADGTRLGELYTTLDEAGAIDYFDWDEYADSNQAPMEGLSFIVVPVTGHDRSVYLFED